MHERFERGRNEVLKPSQRILRISALILLLATLTVICGLVINFKTVFQMWVFLLAAIIPLVGGNFLIYKYVWQNQKLAFILVVSLIGFVFFEFSLLGMLIDSRASNFSWQYILSVAVGIGVGAIIFSTLVSLLYSKIFRAIRKE